MRYLRYIILFSSIVLAPLNNLFADDPIKFLHRPIIFLHGIQTPPKPENGWPTWNSSNSAMMEIINSEYSGYKAGVPLNCCKDSILYTMPDSKRIYNFSYYNPDGSRGVIGNNVNDTTEKEKNPSFWRKLSYGIGYEGGLCAPGRDLAEETPPFTFNFPPRSYWVNGAFGELSYPLNGKKISIGVGYSWWPELTNTVGLSLYVPSEDTLIYYSYVTTNQWELSMLYLTFGLKLNPTFVVGVSVNYCNAETKEELMVEYYDSLKFVVDTTAYVQRKCIGGGIFCGWEGSSMFGTSRLKPYLKLQLGWAREYENNSPWEWNDKLTVTMGGIFLGLKFEIGG